LNLAEQEGLKAVAGGLKWAKLFDDLAAVQFQQGKPDDALDSLESALAAKPDSILEARVHLVRGLIYLLVNKNYNRAQEDYRQAATIEGDETIKQRIRAEAHALLGYIAARQRNSALADREAALAMAQLVSVNDWMLWFNLAGLYVAQADNDAERRDELHDIAILMVRHCLYQADRIGSRAKAIEAIQGDDALEPLREHPDFKTLIAPPAGKAP
jgi:tetratricopeptide (TPR) repeat protein